MPLPNLRPRNPRRELDERTAYAVTDPQEVDDGPNPSFLVEPIAEEFPGQVYPYRGTESHGVDQAFTPEPSPDEWEGGSVVIDTTPPEPEKVQPVRIVEKTSTEYDSWSVTRDNVADAPVMIVGRNRRRKQVTIRNLHAADTLMIGTANSSSLAGTGFPIPAGTERVISATEPVWAVSVTVNQIPVAMLTEFTAG